MLRREIPSRPFHPHGDRGSRPRPARSDGRPCHDTLSILDLAPIPSGEHRRRRAAQHRSTWPGARRQFGYHRYWVAEHHFAPGVASAAPAVLIGLVAAATSTIRVGSGAVQLGHQTALAVVEQFGTARRAVSRPHRPRPRPLRPAPRPSSRQLAAADPAAARCPARVVDGLLIPPPFSFAALAASPRFALYGSLLQQPGARAPDFAEQVDDILALLAGTYRSAEGPGRARRTGRGRGPGAVDPGQQRRAERAGRRRSAGLPFAANYHVSPSTVLEAVDAYRAAFKPSTALAAPHVIVSADVVVAADDDTARRARLAVRAVGAQHPHRRGRDPVPDAGGGRRPRVDRRGPRAGRRPARHPVRRLAAGRSPRSCASCAASPAPTSCSSPRSPTTTPTGSAPSSCSPRSGGGADRAGHSGPC